MRDDQQLDICVSPKLWDTKYPMIEKIIVQNQLAILGYSHIAFGFTSHI